MARRIRRKRRSNLIKGMPSNHLRRESSDTRQMSGPLYLVGWLMVAVCFALGLRLCIFVENHKSDLLRPLEQWSSWPRIRKWQKILLNSHSFYVSACCAATASFALATLLVMVLRGDIVSEKSKEVVGPNQSLRIEQGFYGD